MESEERAAFVKTELDRFLSDCFEEGVQCKREYLVQLLAAVCLDRIALSLEKWPERIWEQLARLASAYEKQRPKLTEAARAILMANGVKLK